jgi:diguanylate cyclase (GGDEF)-like protein
MTNVLILQLLAFSAFPLYFTTLSGPLRQIHFYIYIALVLLIGGYLGNIFSLQVADGVVISGGNVCYSAFMMTCVMFVWIEKNAFILRHLVKLVILVDIFNIGFSFLVHSILTTNGTINPHGVPPAIFEVSVPLILLGGVLIVTELLLLLFIFEHTKKRVSSLFLTGAIYLFSFILVLVLDGVVFPFIAFGINSEIVTLVIGGLSGKILTALTFSLPLALFMVWQRRAFVDYLQSDTIRWRLLVSSSSDLIKEMAQKEQDIRHGDTVFRNSTEGLAIVDQTGTVLKANPAFSRMLNIAMDASRPKIIDLENQVSQVNGRPINLPKELNGKWRREVVFGKEERRFGILSITPAGNDVGGKATYVYSLTDISEQKNAQRELEYLALHDQLTGLPNRRALDKFLGRRHDTPFALVIIDLDHFKDVNDSYGHLVGDKVLRVIASRLEEVRKKFVDENNMLCRLGGDEFAFVINTAGQTDIEGTLESIRATLDQTIRVNDGIEVFSSATIGVSFQTPQGDRDPLLEADAALYEAKRTRRGSVGVYEDRLTLESQKQMTLGLKLKHAISNNQLEVYYQPQFDAVSHQLRGVEALARWTDTELGPVPPSDFIPVAERMGLIDALGDYVLKRACQDGQEWLGAGYDPVRIAVNVSASQLRFGCFTSVLKKTLSDTGFPADKLEIEITESSYIEREAEVASLLSELRAIGVSIAVDDFGTGYSSLSYLREMPWNAIKIDRSFITDIPNDTKQCNLTSAIIRLAKEMSFTVVAEGVETKEQLDFLVSEGCDLIQGYYFLRALPKEGLIEQLKGNSSFAIT